MKLLACVLAGMSLAAFPGCGGTGQDEEPLTVGAASSLRSALADYRGAGDSAIPEVRISFAGSGLIASQIIQGAGIDVFAAASTTDPEALYEEGLVSKPVAYASNRMVIGVPVDSQIDSIDDLGDPGVSVVIGDDSVPVGAYAREIVGGLPADLAAAITGNVRSEEPDAASITAKLTQGAADAGFIYATDARTAPAGVEVVRVPADLQPSIVYSAAVVNASEQPEVAAGYIDGLLSGDGARRLEAAGFLPAP